jgi:putative FmdB family regulatory protein
VPIYDYVCGSCGHRFEVFRGINEAGPNQCPECGGPVARAFAPPTIHFKGTGWAKSDRHATSARSRRTDAGTPASGSAKPASAGESGTPAAESSATSSTPDASTSSRDVSPSSSGETPEKSSSSQSDR